MNEQMPAILSNSLRSDNIQDTLFTIRSKIFSVEAQKIEETVDGKATINSEYKEYDIEGKIHESYAGPYEVNQQDVTIKLGVGYNSDKYVSAANYKHTRKGNTIKLVSLSSTQLCLGLNSAHRAGVLGTTCVSKNLILIGAGLKASLIGVSTYVATFTRVIGASVSLVAVNVKQGAITARLSALKNVVSTYIARKRTSKKKVSKTGDTENYT